MKRLSFHFLRSLCLVFLLSQMPCFKLFPRRYCKLFPPGSSTHLCCCGCSRGWKQGCLEAAGGSFCERERALFAVFSVCMRLKSLPLALNAAPGHSLSTVSSSHHTHASLEGVWDVTSLAGYCGYLWLIIYHRKITDFIHAC